MEIKRTSRIAILEQEEPFRGLSELQSAAIALLGALSEPGQRRRLGMVLGRGALLEEG